MGPSFKGTDWQPLQMSAPLIEAYYRRPGHNALAEIRQNESLMGATVTDRMRLWMGRESNDKAGADKPGRLPRTWPTSSSTATGRRLIWPPT
ncbi:phage terminase small subunit [Nonomuraea sp. NPDC004702]